MPEDNAAPSANTVDVQDLCGLRMDRAIGIEKKKASWFAPVGKLFKAAAQTIGFCMEMRRSWLSLLTPHASSHVGSAASNSSSHSKLSPDELAYSMDIAIGERFTAVPSSTVASNSDRQVPTPAEVPENNVEIAIGARAGG